MDIFQVPEGRSNGISTDIVSHMAKDILIGARFSPNTSIRVIRVFPESQRDSIIEPRVARRALPWDRDQKIRNPESGWINLDQNKNAREYLMMIKV